MSPECLCEAKKAGVCMSVFSATAHSLTNDQVVIRGNSQRHKLVAGIREHGVEPRQPNRHGTLMDRIDKLRGLADNPDVSETVCETISTQSAHLRHLSFTCFVRQLNLLEPHVNILPNLHQFTNLLERVIDAVTVHQFFNLLKRSRRVSYRFPSLGSNAVAPVISDAGTELADLLFHQCLA